MPKLFLEETELSYRMAEVQGLLSAFGHVLVAAASHDGRATHSAAVRLHTQQQQQQPQQRSTESLIGSAGSSNTIALQGWGPLHLVAALGGSATSEGGPGRPSQTLAQGLQVTPGEAAVAVRALKSAGFEVEQTSTQFGHTPLHIACAVGASAVAAELLRDDGTASARLQAVDTFGHTPLHLAAGSGFRECTELLLNCMLARGLVSLVTAVDKEGRTPLGCAQATGCTRTAESIQRFLSRHVAGSNAPADQISLVSDWLENTVKLPGYIDGFISQGYTNLELWAELGLQEEDFACIGVRVPAHRKQISYYLTKLDREKRRRSSSDENSGASTDDENTSSEDEQQAD